MRKPFLALLLVFAAITDAGPVSADDTRRYSLEVEALPQAGCTSVVQLTNSVETRLDRLVFSDRRETARRILVRITPGPASDTWSARIVVYDGHGGIVGERDITETGTHCTTLDEALIVVIVTTIGFVEEPARSQVTHTAVGASLGVRGDLGLLPRLAPGAAVGVQLDVGDWYVTVDAALWPGVSLQLGHGARAAFQSLIGESNLCWRFVQFAPAALAVCAGAQAGVIRLTAEGLDGPSEQLDAVLRGVVGLRLRLPVATQFGMITGVSAAAPLRVPRYYVVDVERGRQYRHAVGFGVSARFDLYWFFSS